MLVDFTHDKLVEEKELEDLEFKGKVTVEMPPFHERTRFPMKVGLGDYSTSSKEETEESKLKDGLKQVEIMAKAAEEIMQYVKGCDLKNDEGLHITKTEDFFSHPGCGPLVTGLALQFVTGFVSKKKKPSLIP